MTNAVYDELEIVASVALWEIQNEMSDGNANVKSDSYAVKGSEK